MLKGQDGGDSEGVELFQTILTCENAARILKNAKKKSEREREGCE